MSDERAAGGTPVGPALLVVGAATVQEVGAAFAVGLFTALGAAGATLARFAVAGVILCVVIRPRIRGLTRRGWVAAVSLGCALAAMNLCFYNALSRIPLGIAVTVEVLGPLVLSDARSGGSPRLGGHRLRSSSCPSHSSRLTSTPRSIGTWRPLRSRSR
jgi:threonine/homoserine efflux transporter RhtA